MKYKQMSPYQADNDLVDSAEDHARVYIEAAVFFMCFFYTWLELTHCLLRFKNLNGIFDDVMYFFYLAGEFFTGRTQNIYGLRCCWNGCEFESFRIPYGAQASVLRMVRVHDGESCDITFLFSTD